MRATLLIVLLALAFSATAEEKPKPKITKDIDKATPILMQSQGGNDETNTERPTTKARDYNSSRSNNESSRSQADGADYNSSRSNKTHTPKKSCQDGEDNDCNAAAPIAQGSLEKTRARQAPANHNTTRSNRTSE